MDSIKNGFSTWAPQRSKNTDEVTKRISESAEGLPAEILDYQKQKATEILSCCIQPGAIRDSKRVGLVVGKVQSGKTTSFTYLSSLAADNGYKIIIHLLGTTKNLVKDNANSVQEILSTNNSSNHWYAKEFDGDSFVSDFPHTTMEQKLYPRETGLDFLGNNRPETVVYIYLIKNHNMIDRLASYLSDFHENLEAGHSPLPILIAHPLSIRISLSCRFSFISTVRSMSISKRLCFSWSSFSSSISISVSASNFVINLIVWIPGCLIIVSQKLTKLEI